MTSPSPLRFGRAGTGHRERVTHAPALASTDGMELAAAWGRDPGKAASLAAAHGAAACADFGESSAGWTRSRSACRPTPSRAWPCAPPGPAGTCC
jgi:hypothetical protein